ncbi:unnamed protein product, partial [Cylicocyclus nassatus]
MGRPNEETRTKSARYIALSSTSKRSWTTSQRSSKQCATKLKRKIQLQNEARKLRKAINNLTTAIEAALKNLSLDVQSNAELLSEEGEGADAAAVKEKTQPEDIGVESMEKGDDDAHMGQREAETIRNNQEYVEELVIEMEEAAPSEEPQVEEVQMEEPKMGENEAHADEPPRNEEAMERPQEARLRNEDLLSALQVEKKQTLQAIHDLNLLIDALEKENTCGPRRYHKGEIRKDTERNMSCAFCSAVGYHYSDSCPEVPTGRERRELLEASNRCETCLEYCAGGNLCRKFYTKCFHCRETGHHSALCELPDRSQDIFDQIEKAERSKQGNFQQLPQANRHGNSGAPPGPIPLAPGEYRRDRI